MPDSAETIPSQPAGWIPDPDDGGLLRYWTGSKWTEDRTPAIQPPGVSAPASFVDPPQVAFVQVAKSTTAGVLLWLFLGGLGAHRHYVGKHLSAVLQPLFYAIGWTLVVVGMNMQNPGGIGPNTTLATVGGLIAAPIAIWVIADVFFISGWVREWNQRHGGAGKP